MMDLEDYLVANLVDFVAFLGVKNLEDKNSRVMAGRQLGPRRKKRRKSSRALIWSQELP